MASQARYKVHLYNFNEHQKIPAHQAAQYESLGLKGTLCGRVGKSSTYPLDVECKRCKKLIQMVADARSTPVLKT
jgi:folate-dependent tRNA-U54 methylase TrmFO/GidA